MLNLDFNEGLSLRHRDVALGRARRRRAARALVRGRNDVVCEGEAEGILFGGCLSLTTALTGTPYDFWIDDGIWFWEDVDEPLYRIDRMLTHLRLSGRMQKIRGVIIGALKNCGSDAEMLALFREFFGSLAIPVVQQPAIRSSWRTTC
jgi:muramoyltetrapeptide carboxypeptidase LdcA involved in peptidoglycan recycling